MSCNPLDFGKNLFKRKESCSFFKRTPIAVCGGIGASSRGFENGVDAWNVGCVNNGGINFNITAANNTSGQVHDGEGSLKFNLNGLNFANAAGSYKQVAIYPEKDIIIKNAKSIGAWIYIPDEFYNLWIRFHYYYENADGTYTKKNTVPVFNQPGVYNEVNDNSPLLEPSYRKNRANLLANLILTELVKLFVSLLH